MSKKTLMTIILFVVIVIIGGIIFFTRNKENIQINIDELSQKLIAGDIFTDELTKVNSDIIMKDYSFTSDEIKEIVSYQGSGATSEELVILQVNDKSFLDSVKNKINTRLEERKEAFESYLPEEVFKIDDKLLEIEGNYVILCISNDSDTANKIIKDEIKNGKSGSGDIGWIY